MKNAVRHMQNESSKEKEKKAGSTIFVNLNHIYVKGKEKCPFSGPGKFA